MKTRRLLFVILLIMIIAPYLIASASGGNKMVFGGFLMNPIDGQSYLAKMNLGREGVWLFSLPYSSTKGEGTFIFTFYIFLGWLAGSFGVSNLVVFHSARILAAVGLFWAFERFIRILVGHRKSLSEWMIALLLFGGGLGWLVFFSGYLTADFWVAEAFPFLSMYSSPHFTLGMAILIWVLYEFIKPDASPQKSSRQITVNYLKLAIAGILIAGIMPFGYVVGSVILAGTILWDWISERKLVWQPLVAFGLLGGVYLLYQFITIQNNSMLSIWNNQNLTPAPPLWDTVISFSPPLLVGFWSAWRLRISQHQRWYRIMVVWMILGLILVYVPFNLQRRFLFAFFIPCVCLSILGLENIVKHHKTRKRWLVLIGGSSLLTNLIILTLAVFGITTQSQAFYISTDEYSGIKWLESHTQSGSIILAAPDTGLYIPAWANRRVLYGHPFETVNAEVQKRKVVDFFTGMIPLSEAEVWLRENSVECVFWGPREKKLGVLPLLGLKASFIQGDVEIYCRGWAN